jgi:membrane fusion protein (multidrug efflux system)
LKTARTNVDFYQREYQRQADLAGRQVVSQAQLDKARRDLDTARQQAASLVQQLASIAADLNGDPNIPVEKHPRYLAAEAARDQAARDLAHTVVKAPTAGVVTNVDSLQPGEYLAAASPAFSLVAIDHVWVEANPKETQLTYVRPGQPATVDVDTYPGVEWRGEVASLSPASGSEFALLPAQNTSGNWVKVVQRIPIRIRIKTQPGQPPLRAGMSVEVEIDTGHRRNVLRFLAGLFGGGGQKKAA